MAERSYAVVLEPSEEGGYVVSVPALPEIATQGETVEEALTMARDAIALSLSARIDEGLVVPPSDAKTARLEVVTVPFEAA